MTRLVAALSRNSRKLLTLLLVSSAACLLLLHSNADIEKQLQLGHQFFRQLRELQSSNVSTGPGADTDNAGGGGDPGDGLAAGAGHAAGGHLGDAAHNHSDHHGPVPVDQETSLFSQQTEFEVSIWIDLPNAFPWRYCIQQYNNLFATLNCDNTSADQKFKIVPLPDRGGDGERHFELRTRRGWCVVPGAVSHEGAVRDSVKAVRQCGEAAGHWVWTGAGQLRWTEGCHKCVQSLKFNHPVQFRFCKNLTDGENIEDQNLELGVWRNGSLAPLDDSAWQRRQAAIRQMILDTERAGVRAAVAEVEVDTMLHEFDTADPARRRRAAVFYLDRGSGGLDMVRWWIYTWRFIGLDTAEQGFDLVMLTHPASVAQLPAECSLVEEGFRLNYTAAGRCLYKPYLGVAHRDKSYDPYMNSQECLFGPGSEFLGQYSHLLRADLDTFPTPRFLDWWPEGIIVDRNYHTNFNLDSIKQAIKDVACSAGIEHRGWYNPGSTWYGPARRVRHMARLTVALNKFGRAAMFGPGTACRCASCNKLPKTCEWGGGPYAGTMLLYLQEIAVNKVMTAKEWDSLPGGLLDQGVADNSRSVCSPALLHCMHNAERFSKLAFGMGKYKGEDMSGLDITKVRDYATFMALTATGQGKGGEAAIARFNETVLGGAGEDKPNDEIWKEFCKNQKP